MQLSDHPHMTTAALQDAVRILGRGMAVEGHAHDSAENDLIQLVEEVLWRAPADVTVMAMATMASLLVHRCAALSGFTPTQELSALAKEVADFELRPEPVDDDE